MPDIASKFWARIEPTALILSLVVVAVVWGVNSCSEWAKLKLEYVRLAIGVLQTDTKKQSGSEVLRPWAVKVLQDSSPIKLTTDQAEALKNGNASFPARRSLSISPDYSYDTPAYDYDTPDYGYNKETHGNYNGTDKKKIRDG